MGGGPGGDRGGRDRVLVYRRPLVPLAGAQRWTLTALRGLTLALVVVFLCRAGHPAAARGRSRSRRAGARGRVGQHADCGCGRRHPAGARRRDPRARPRAGAVRIVHPRGVHGRGCLDRRAAWRHAGRRQAEQPGRSDRRRSRALPRPARAGHRPDLGRRDHRERRRTRHWRSGIHDRRGVCRRSDRSRSPGTLGGRAALDQTSIDLRISTVSRGYGRSPFQLRILVNGRLLESRTLTPAADGSPIEQVVTVSPEAAVATVYTAEIEAADGEAVVENNARSVLVSPTGRKRKVLALAGAPGYDFSFLSRALGRDPGLEFDSIVRKGQNEAGQHTFLVQAGAGRAAALTSGFPATRESLYGYDAVILANVEGDFFGRAQLAMAADFVAVRGGGLIALGGRSFGQRGLIGTPLEEALPVELNDRRGGLARAAADAEGAPVPNAVMRPPKARPTPRCGSARRRKRPASAGRPSRHWPQTPPSAGHGRERRFSPSRWPRAVRATRSLRCSATDAAGRWCSAAKRHGGGACWLPPPIAPTSTSGVRRRDGSPSPRPIPFRSSFRPPRAGPSDADRGRGARRGARRSATPR